LRRGQQRGKRWRIELMSVFRAVAIALLVALASPASAQEQARRF
jgi:hypothetical protein